MNTDAAYEQALIAWRTLLGDQHVLTDAETRRAAASATFATSAQVPALIQPGNRAELAACLEIARRYRVPVYPVSRGKNWGYGSRVPWGDRQTILSLHRLDQILAFDDRLATITVEPGVTFQQLYAFLADQQASVTIAGPGSTLQASVVGNVVERGLAVGLGGEKWEQVCALEVLLADGRMIYTGSGRYQNAADAAVPTAGPLLHGLFSQFNSGIILSLTLQLTPIPAFYQHVSFSINQPAQLTPLLTALQSLKRAEIFTAPCGLHNDYKLLTFTTCAPPPDRLLTRAEFTAPMRQLLQGLAWWGESLVTAPSEAIGALKRRLIKDALGPVTETLSFEEAGAANPLISHAAPTGLHSAYWRKPQTDGRDPDQDRCGVIWHSSIVPFDPAAIETWLATAEAVLTDFQFEPVLGLQCHSFRAVYLIISILYDRDRPNQDEQALACYQALTTRLAAQGCYPYRAGTQAAGHLPPPDDDVLSLLRDLKLALDPFDILAPGHYDERAYDFET